MGVDAAPNALPVDAHDSKRLKCIQRKKYRIFSQSKMTQEKKVKLWNCGTHKANYTKKKLQKNYSSKHSKIQNRKMIVLFRG